MKRLFFSAILVSASTVTFAQSSTATPAETKQATEVLAVDPVKTDDERKEVKTEELPAAVRTELSTVQYKGWTASNAWWVREGKTEFYEITMVMGNESKKVKYNAEGSKLD